MIFCKVYTNPFITPCIFIFCMYKFYVFLVSKVAALKKNRVKVNLVSMVERPVQFSSKLTVLNFCPVFFQ